MLQPGDPIPAFALPDQHGMVISREQLMGQAYLLYFYPKDDTPGCTTEACEFQDASNGWPKNLRVIGVSPDTSASHARFAGKYGLEFTLLADIEHALAAACGVWVEKKNYGKTYFGVERTSFLVSAEGIVQRVWSRVKPAGHAAEVLAAFVQ